METETPLPPRRARTGRRPVILIVVSLLLVTVGVWLGRGPFVRHSPASAAATQAQQLYTCGMHPQVIWDHPGNCPICGMVLTPVRRQPGAGSAAAASDSSAIAIDPVTTQNMGIRTDSVKRGPLRRTIRTVAAIDYDETALADPTTVTGLIGSLKLI